MPGARKSKRAQFESPDEPASASASASAHERSVEAVLAPASASASASASRSALALSDSVEAVLASSGYDLSGAHDAASTRAAVETCLRTCEEAARKLRTTLGLEVSEVFDAAAANAAAKAATAVSLELSEKGAYANFVAAAKAADDDGASLTPWRGHSAGSEEPPAKRPRQGEEGVESGEGGAAATEHADERQVSVSVSVSVLERLLHIDELGEEVLDFLDEDPKDLGRVRIASKAVHEFMMGWTLDVSRILPVS